MFVPLLLKKIRLGPLLLFVLAVSVYQITASFVERRDIAIMNLALLLLTSCFPDLSGRVNYRFEKIVLFCQLLVRTYAIFVVTFSLMLQMASYYAWGGRATFGLISSWFNTLIAGKSSWPLSMQVGVVTIVLTVAALSYVCATQIQSILRTFRSNRLEFFSAAFWILPSAFFASVVCSYPLTLARLPLFMTIGYPDVHYYCELTPSKLQNLSRDRVSKDQWLARFRKEVPVRNVAVILSDSLRSGNMSSYGYGRETTPFIDSELRAHRAVKVSNAFAVCPDTACGLSALFTGRQLNTVSRQSVKFYELLKAVGYKVHLILSGEHRNWDYLSGFYGDSVDSIFDHRNTSSLDPDDDEVVTDGLRNLSFTKDPTFVYLHLKSSHATGMVNKQFNRFLPASEKFEELYWHTLPPEQFDKSEFASVSARITNRYDNRVLQADYYLSEIFGILREKGFFTRPFTIFVLADHGDSLGETGYVGHRRGLSEGELRIPMIIWDDDLTAFNNQEFGSLYDVAPTIFDRIGFSGFDRWIGHSLVSKRDNHPLFVHTNRHKGLCRGLIEWRSKEYRKFTLCEEAGAGAQLKLLTLSDPRGVSAVNEISLDSGEGRDVIQLLDNALPRGELGADFNMVGGEAIW